MKPIRILIAGMPKMLLDILDHVVASEPDMAVAGRINADEDLIAAARRFRADVVLLEQMAEDEREGYVPLLVQQPRLQVFAIKGDGSSGTLYRLRPQRIRIGELSADVLCKAIRERPLSPDD